MLELKTFNYGNKTSLLHKIKKQGNKNYEKNLQQQRKFTDPTPEAHSRDVQIPTLFKFNCHLSEGVFFQTFKKNGTNQPQPTTKKKNDPTGQRPKSFMLFRPTLLRFAKVVRSERVSSTRRQRSISILWRRLWRLGGWVGSEGGGFLLED